MGFQDWLRPPRAVLTLFFLLMASCALVLGWLGWRVLEQDRVVEAQRLQEQLAHAADGVVNALDAGLKAGEVQVVIRPSATEVTPVGGLAFLPAEHSATAPPAAIFAAAEALEFGAKASTDAASAYLGMAESGNPAVRAEALVRAGRVLRREHRWREAFATYRKLEGMANVTVAGMPSALVARAARCSVLEESGAAAELAREAGLLWNDLLAGRFPVTRSILETYLDEIRRWAPDAAMPGDWRERFLMAQAAEAVWRDSRAAKGKKLLLIEGQPVAVVWSTSDEEWRASISGPRYWSRLRGEVQTRFGVAVRATDDQGAPLTGEGIPTGRGVFRAAALTGLPMNIAVMPAPGKGEPDSSSARRRLLLTGMLVFAVLLVGGSFLIAKAIAKESAVARLQSNFVSAVSHEFRTPLTSIRQLTELLARGRMQNQEQRQKAYELMMSESDRLKRLVESVLDFGRMESGGYQFEFTSLTAGEWASNVVAAFRDTVGCQAGSIEFTATGDPARIRADREALSGALWNLLDNAVKYSTGEMHVRAAVATVNGKVEVSVADQGMGISPEDLRHVFERFYRSEAARAAGTRGTGIGLAVVQEIVKAHGGAVRAQSEPGRGSRFTIVLPREESV